MSYMEPELTLAGDRVTTSTFLAFLENFAYLGDFTHWFQVFICINEVNESVFPTE